jgi:CDP-archaeol synthase
LIHASASDCQADPPAQHRQRNARCGEKGVEGPVFAAARRRADVIRQASAIRPVKDSPGALASVVLTTAAAPLLGFEPSVGAVVGCTAIIGDLLSSFVKRRLGFAPSSQAMLLDQIPEALFPVLACSVLLPLSAVDIVVVVASFSVGAILLSPVFHRIGLRDRPF